MSDPPPLVLVTGATGYIGGRLVPRLLEAGFRVRCLVRDEGRLQGRPWRDQIEVVTGDVLVPETLPPAVAGVGVLYYLVHSMAGGADYHQRDLAAARNTGQAAATAGVHRIIYLGGLGDSHEKLSPHLRSRQQTGEALREAGVPVTEFRAAVIVGSGSVSFEMVRYLAERLPVMICPKWVQTRTQPIAVRNVLDYLVATLRQPASVGRTLDIGGTDVMRYADMLRIYAEVRGLKRYLITVPVLTPRMSSLWVHVLTPVPASIAGPLVEGLRNEVVVREHTARQLFPDIKLLDYRTAVRYALERLESGRVETAWTDAWVTQHGDVQPVVLTNHEGLAMERRRKRVATSPERLFQVFSRLGGERGWLYMNWAWDIRGAIDWMLGGVGMRRGRRDPDEVRVGDAVDFWRVEAVDPRRLLRLRAEMKVPGRAWLEFEARPTPEGTILTQTALFAPKGMTGWVYWHSLYPVHKVMFRGMVNCIAREALQGVDEHP